MSYISGIDIISSSLDAQKTRLDIVAENIANSQTTRAADGLPYQRKLVTFESELARRLGDGGIGNNGVNLQKIKVSGITKDTTPGERVYDPQHPHADAAGMVTMPNVNLAHEMVDLISATRVYEANLSVAKNAKNMALKALDIGK